MKKILVTVAIFFTAQFCSAQMGEKYMSAMKKNLEAIDSAFRNPESLLALANNFERIAEAEKIQWLPYYYAAFCQVNYGFMQQDKSKTDAIADKATTLVEKADVLSPQNSELSCLKSMIASCHLMVNPMQRYMEYGPVSTKHLTDAIQFDATNPRPELLIGQGLKYTPEQFGGGCSTAKPKIESAIKKFDEFKPASSMHPSWGKEMAVQILNECK